MEIFKLASSIFLFIDKNVPFLSGHSEILLKTLLSFYQFVIAQECKSIVYSSFLFFITFIGMGILAFALGKAYFTTTVQISNPLVLLDILMPNFFPIIILITGIVFLNQYTTPIIFNKNMGYFWKGRLGKNQ